MTVSPLLIQCYGLHNTMLCSSPTYSRKKRIKKYIYNILALTGYHSTNGNHSSQMDQAEGAQGFKNGTNPGGDLYADHR